MSDMKFGVMSDGFGDWVSVDGIHEMGEATADNGFDSFYLGDHVTLAEDMSKTYPAMEDGTPPMEFSDDLYDSLITLAVLAGENPTLNIGTNICVAPLRHPIALTRQVFTLEALSGGRFRFGVGAGWLRNEYEVVGKPYEERGALFDEFLEIFTRARENGEVEYQGEHYSFQKTSLHPQPDDGRPPILVGGASSAAIRRVAEFGDGWTIAFLSPDEIPPFVDRIDNAWEDFDRKGAPEIVLFKRAFVDTDDNSLDSPNFDNRYCRNHVETPKRGLVGTPDKIISDITEFEDAGVSRIIVQPYDPENMTSLIELFGSEVLPSF